MNIHTSERSNLSALPFKTPNPNTAKTTPKTLHTLIPSPATETGGQNIWDSNSDRVVVAREALDARCETAEVASLKLYIKSKVSFITVCVHLTGLNQM